MLPSPSPITSGNTERAAPPTRPPLHPLSLLNEAHCKCIQSVGFRRRSHEMQPEVALRCC
eukprot:scaffold42860_cov216-Skeletonema_dohrnii-CCMP3373.AAC.1